jgi:hypothetical protein
MADPISMIGLVSGIITFIDFGLKIVSQTRKLRDAAGNDSTDEVDELDRYIESVREWNSKILNQQSSTLKLSQDEKHMLQKVQQCESLATELQGLIGSLKIPKDAKSKTFKVAKLVFQRRWKQGDIADLQLRLRNLEVQIRRDVEGALQL